MAIPHWKTLNRKTPEKAMIRAVDAVADLIEIVHAKGLENKYNILLLEDIMDKIRKACPSENEKRGNNVE